MTVAAETPIRGCAASGHDVYAVDPGYAVDRGPIVHRINRITPINHVIPVDPVTGDAVVAVATEVRN